MLTPRAQSIEALVARALALVATADGRRVVLGIAGAPGAGKSLVAAELVRAAGAELEADRVVGAPMDGFHRTNAELRATGALDRKGAPDTFDAGAFVAALRSLRTEPRERRAWPGYSRVTHEPVPAATVIGPAVDLVVVEGNYLLLATPPWTDVRAAFDQVWFVAPPPREVLRARLLRRQLAGGATPDAAAAHVDGSDLPNADLVAATSSAAHLLVDLDPGDPALDGLLDPATGEPFSLDRT